MENDMRLIPVAPTDLRVAGIGGGIEGVPMRIRVTFEHDEVTGEPAVALTLEYQREGEWVEYSPGLASPDEATTWMARLQAAAFAADVGLREWANDRGVLL